MVTPLAKGTVCRMCVRLSFNSISPSLKRPITSAVIWDWCYTSFPNVS